MDAGTWSYQRFLDGDQEGLVQIIQEYRDGLMLYLNGFVGNLTVAEDLTEDTFLKLVLKKPRFSARSSFKTWLYAIGRNLALDHLKRSGAPSIPLEDCQTLADEAALEQRYIQREEQRVVNRAMKALKPEYRQVLWLIYFEGFTCAEAAKIMKKSPHNTETLVWRARNALKIKLIKEGFEYEDL
ncbi:MAG: RNA polymerase sigma factor [Oscillospiraceae bacterium]|nr:RNA polymerase sigma factor [Oscillospiraceae bacterium]